MQRSTIRKAKKNEISEINIAPFVGACGVERFCSSA
jgi:hypothetical protein